MSKRKLEKIIALNNSLQDQLELPRIPVSEASESLIEYTKNTYDNILEMAKGNVVHDPFIIKKEPKCRCVVTTIIRKNLVSASSFSALGKVFSTNLHTSSSDQAVSSNTLPKLKIPEYNRFSAVFFPTQKSSNDKKESFVPTGDLLLRAGYIRQTGSGGQRISMPSLLPIDAWKKTNRYYKLGSDLFKLSDRKGTPYILGPTYEEEITQIVGNEPISYKRLPLRIYQITSKYRDEMRPRSMLLRGREFIMKDMYTFDVDEKNALGSYRKVRSAYHKIFKKIGVPYAIADADSGDIGGSLSQEFHIISQDGEDTLLQCNKCGYVANEEKAVGIIADTEKTTESSALDWLEAKNNQKQIYSAVGYVFCAQNSTGGGNASTKTSNQMNNKASIFLTLNNRKLNYVKCKTASAAINSSDLGEEFVNLEQQNTSFADLIDRVYSSLLSYINKNPTEGTTIPEKNKFEVSFFIDSQSIHNCENQDGFSEHIKNALSKYTRTKSEQSTPELSIIPKNAIFSDLIVIDKNDKCKKCHESADLRNEQNGADMKDLNVIQDISSEPILENKRAIEIGHIFYLGTKYSSVLEAVVLLKNLKSVPIHMGCYGIGVMRSMQAAADAVRDSEGLIWPLSIAPYSVLIVPILPRQFNKVNPEVSEFDHLVDSISKADQNSENSSNIKTVENLVSGINNIVQSLTLIEHGTSKEAESISLFKSKTNLFDCHNIALDDRFNLSSGYRLYDSEMLGIPFVVVLGSDFFESGGKYAELRIRKFKNLKKQDRKNSNLDSKEKLTNSDDIDGPKYLHRKVPIDQIPNIIMENL
ncbi:hypothetical protein BB560_001505 [Smittium megazygosporum]|uniref:proline--tRNA ligase n=1 Tax=Smittium megazygosporum TaxID=133381 RepID=A0A2T9ZHF4_9FUNG|nr:hypothetical protein BB560_001505 [Smittium megazygosporum]